MILILSFQFIVAMPWVEETKWNLSQKAWFEFLGFKNYQDDIIWHYLAPYVILFSLSVLLYRNFKKKAGFEKLELLVEDSSELTNQS